MELLGMRYSQETVLEYSNPNVASFVALLLYLSEALALLRISSRSETNVDGGP